MTRVDVAPPRYEAFPERRVRGATNRRTDELPRNFAFAVRLSDSSNGVHGLDTNVSSTRRAAMSAIGSFLIHAEYRFGNGIEADLSAIAERRHIQCVDRELLVAYCARRRVRRVLRRVASR